MPKTEPITSIKDPQSGRSKRTGLSLGTSTKAKMPAWVHSRKRRWALLLEQIPVASIALRSSTRGRWHPNGCGFPGGNNDFTLAHNSSGIRQLWLAFGSFLSTFSFVFVFVYVVDIILPIGIGSKQAERRCRPPASGRRRRGATLRARSILHPG